MTNLVILGISHPISWNGAASLLVNGELIAFAEEERFIRLKHAPNVYPKNAVNFCLRKANLCERDITIVAVGFSNPLEFPISSELIKKNASRDLTLSEKLQLNTSVSLHHYDSLIPALGKKRIYFDHHKSHVASTVIPSNFCDTNFITLDGWGGDKSGLLGWCKNREDLEIIKPISINKSWGALFETVTYIIGFRPHSAEGKTMGLASYGAVDVNLLPDWCDKTLGLPDVARYKTYLINKFTNSGGLLASEDERISLAATLQHYYQRSLLRMGEYLYKKSGIKNFSLAGGVALNCTGNGVLAQASFVENLFVMPASNDAGTALGSAILAHKEVVGYWPDIKFSHVYWGEEFTNEEIERALIFSGLSYQKVNPAQEVAKELSKNKVLGFFQGRAEVGPRALGGRSILAHPGYKKNLERINLNIKRREIWRPLAPSILEEDYSLVFEGKISSPYMLLATQVREGWRLKIPAVTHVDGSARPQRVNAVSNPVFHQAITNFKKLTGLPLVLNTSFNLDDEPLVNSPENAIATFARSGLDTLIIGSFAMKKEK